MGAPASYNILRAEGDEFVRVLQRAVRLAGAYADDDERRKNHCDQAWSALKHLLETTGTLSLGFVGTEVILNSVALNAVRLEWLASQFAARGISHVTLREGIDAGELSAIVELLATDPEQVQEKGGASAWLSGRPVQHATIFAVEGGSPVAPAAAQQDAGKELAGASGELLQSVVLKNLRDAAASGQLEQAERMLRRAAGPKPNRKTLGKMLPREAASPETLQALDDYIEWLCRPLPERLAELQSEQPGRQFRWFVLQLEHEVGKENLQRATELVLALLRAPWPQALPEREQSISRILALLQECCGADLPSNASAIAEALIARLREEDATSVVALLLESLALLTQLAADKGELPLALSGADFILQMVGESSHRAPLAREIQSRLLLPSTMNALLFGYLDRRDDPRVQRQTLPLLQRLGDQAARALIALLEEEPVATRRLQMLQLLKSLGPAAKPALLEKVTHPKWYLVRNVVLALGELADAEVLDHLAPALAHADERVQKAAVAATLRGPSSVRGVTLANALPALTPSLLDTVLDDLMVLKEPKAVPYLEQLIRQPRTDVPLLLTEKVLFALGAVENNEAVHCLADCASETSLSLPHRRAALLALSRVNLPSARHALKYFAHSEPDPQLAEEARQLIASLEGAESAPSSDS